MGEDGNAHPLESITASEKGEVPMVHCLTAPYGESGAGATVRSHWHIDQETKQRGPVLRSSQGETKGGSQRIN